MPSFAGSGSPGFCFGRDAILVEIASAARERGAVLLFGGRQSGKTTILRKIEQHLGGVKYDSEKLALAEIPVYVNLLNLPHDAKPGDFFSMLLKQAVESCKRQILGFDAGVVPPDGLHSDAKLDTFIYHLGKLLKSSGNLDLSFLFLLDEAKRILGSRFPRGFQDNVFTFLYGDSSVSGSCPIVFAGSQELYRLCEDDTSPISSRAARKLMSNLGSNDLVEMVIALNAGLDRPEAERRAAMLYAITGGQPGLSSLIARRICKLESVVDADLRAHSEAVQYECAGLFEVWVGALSPEARAVHDLLVVKGSLEKQEISRHLNKIGLDPIRSDRVREELEFSGIAIRKGERLEAVNRMYAEIARTYVVEDVGTEEERSVWSTIEQVELSTRALIRLRFDKRWAPNANDMIRKALGEEAWKKILENQDKYEKSYPLSKPAGPRDILDFTYFGQLVQLMVWGQAWDMFKHLFRDKRELEDMNRAVNPVRNDSAHFRSVPDRELDRCRITCEDLLAIIEREQANPLP